MDLVSFILLGSAVYRLSLFADDPRLLKKLKKIHESFASAAFASLWIAAIILSANVFFHDNSIFKIIVGTLALSGLTCLLSQIRGRPQFIMPFPEIKPPGDRPPTSLL